MKIIRQNLLPVGKKFSAINLFGILFVKRNVKVGAVLINHEKIHTAQQRELGYVFFYIWYLLEWIYRLLRNRFDPYKAYSTISFENEAYRHQQDLTYLRKRRPYAFLRLHTGIGD